VIEASTNRTEAVISCAPFPCHGKCGDKIQSNSGIMTIRLIVMEFGKFTKVPQKQEHHKLQRKALLKKC
jgi:hypothetical protein